MRRRKVWIIIAVFLVLAVGVGIYKWEYTPKPLKELEKEEISKIKVQILSEEYTLTGREDIEQLSAILAGMKLSRQIFPINRDGVFASVDVCTADGKELHISVENEKNIRINGKNYISDWDYCEVFRNHFR